MPKKEFTFELTNGQVSLDLSKIFIAKYYKKKKGKKYKYYYCYKNLLSDDFFETVFQNKTPRKKLKGLINSKTGRVRNV